MAQAGESDGKVIQRLRDHEAAFAALSPDAAANQLPRLQVRPVNVLFMACQTPLPAFLMLMVSTYIAPQHAVASDPFHVVH
jgi:hypothetical protein